MRRIIWRVQSWLPCAMLRRTTSAPGPQSVTFEHLVALGRGPEGENDDFGEANQRRGRRHATVLSAPNRAASVLKIGD